MCARLRRRSNGCHLSWIPVCHHRKSGPLLTPHSYVLQWIAHGVVLHDNAYWIQNRRSKVAWLAHMCTFIHYGVGLCCYLICSRLRPWVPHGVWQSDKTGDETQECGISQTRSWPKTRPFSEHNDRTYIHEASWDVEQTRYLTCEACVYCATNSADANKAGYPTVGSRTKERQMNVVLLLFRWLWNVGTYNFGMWCG